MAKKRTEDEAYAEALKRIEVCLKKMENTLDLSGLSLKTLPPEIGQLNVLNELYIQDNYLTMLPAEIGKLPILTCLYLYNNRLTKFPLQICQLSKLTELYIGENNIAELPPDIGELTALEKLYLYRNKLTTLPSEIGKLTAVTRLSLNNNQLITLPEGISKLKALSRFYLYDNQLTTLPTGIGQLKALTRLALAHNQLMTLPSEIGLITTLEELYLHENPGLGIPDSVLGPSLDTVNRSNDKNRQFPARPPDILHFYFSRKLGASQGTLRAVGEIKVMLIGRGGAGKTSLRRFFLNQPHNPKEAETHGIALDSFNLKCHGQEIVVRLWDFAGQEITHALHQFFLTEGSVYILVLDPRSNTEMTDAFYWLNLLKRYSGHSPVVVVMNRQDERSGGYDVDRHLLKERFPHIHDFIPTNCATRTGCVHLRAALIKVIETLSPIEPPRLEVPETWLKVKQECFERGHAETNAPGQQVERRTHLSLEQFQQICQAHGEKETEKQKSLARLLHRLGAVLHFVEDPRLNDTSVLDPHWVTDGVYRLLRFKDRPRSDGILIRDDLKKALPDEDEKSARFLLNLMERFEMCYPLDEGDDGKPASQWLIPGALDQYQPAEIGSNWKEPGNVRLRYVYDPLPEGVIPRFIVMTHLLSNGKPRWRNGVVLEDGQATVLVRRGEKPNNVEIIAFGPDTERLRLLQIVQANMDRINSDVPEPRPYLEQEINGLPGTYKRVTELEGAEIEKTPVVVESNRDRKLVKIEPTPQLNRISEPESRNPDRVPLNAFLSYSQTDKRAKEIFVVNLNVMKSKKLITPWHDGLIEPGIQWRDEIEDNLKTMDIFVGLLTNHFVASNFIQTVELKAAREKLRKVGKEFLFVLILVDDISLEGLELAEYQILRPAGKPVCKHKSRKDGFNEAQKELEKLIVSRQEAKKRLNAMSELLQLLQ
jgi:internalin A